jgi:hypothetical protein
MPEVKGWRRMSFRPSAMPDEPAGPVKPAGPVNPAGPVKPATSVESASSSKRASPDKAAKSVKPAPAGVSRLVTAMAVLLVLLFTPAWVDPATIVELSGGTQTASTGQGLPVPDPRTGFVPVSVPVPPAAGPATRIATPSAETVTVANRGDTQAVDVSGTPARDVDISFSIALDQLPAGGTIYVFPLVRSTGNGAAYRPRVFITQDGAVYVHAGLIVGGKEQSLGREVLVANLPDISAHVLRLRAYVAGSDPTSIFVKAWDAATPEPPQWEFGAIDWTGVLQNAGAVGVAAYLGRNVTNAPITVQISDLAVTATDPTN